MIKPMSTVNSKSIQLYLHYHQSLTPSITFGTTPMIFRNTTINISTVEITPNNPYSYYLYILYYILLDTLDY